MHRKRLNGDCTLTCNVELFLQMSDFGDGFICSSHFIYVYVSGTVQLIFACAFSYSCLPLLLSLSVPVMILSQGFAYIFSQRHYFCCWLYACSYIVSKFWLLTENTSLYAITNVVSFVILFYINHGAPSFERPSLILHLFLISFILQTTLLCSLCGDTYNLLYLEI